MSLSVLLEHSLLLVEVMLIRAVGGIKVPSGVEAQGFDVLLIDVIGLLHAADPLLGFGKHRPHSDHLLRD